MRSALKKYKGYRPMRNHDAINPLLRKGGPHGKTRKAERKQARQSLVRATRSGSA